MAVTDLQKVSVGKPAKDKPTRLNQIRAYDHIVLILGVFLMMGPILVAFMTSTYDHVTIHREGMQFGFGGHFAETYANVLYQEGGFTGEVTGLLMTQRA